MHHFKYLDKYLLKLSNFKTWDLMLAGEFQALKSKCLKVDEVDKLQPRENTVEVVFTY